MAAMQRPVTVFLFSAALLGLVASVGCKKDAPQPAAEEAPVAAADVSSPPPLRRPTMAAGAETAVEVDGRREGLRSSTGHLLRAAGGDGGVTVSARVPQAVGEEYSLTARILAPDNRSLAEQKLLAHQVGGSEATFELQGDILASDFGLYRLEYVVVGAATGDERVLVGLDRFRAVALSARVLAPETLLAGGPAAVRIVAMDDRTGQPVQGADVTVTLGDQTLLTAKTDKDGTVDGAVSVPGAAGSGDLVVNVSKLGSEERVVTPVTVKRARRIMLTTDKPMYQPGQTIHLRSLTLKRPSLLPVSAGEVTFEVFDPKSNKVFKRTVKSTPHGIASTSFELASEVIMGAWRVRVQVDDAEQERRFDVKRYVLPKYEVTVKPARPFYLVGQTLEGMVEARYFFDKPVEGRVDLTLETFDVGWSTAQTATGDLKGGQWRFSLPLPDHLVGQPLAGGQAMVRLVAKVTDSAAQPQSRAVQVPVAEDPLRLDVIVSDQRLLMGAMNEVLILVSTPDGRPVKGATLALEYGGEKQTDVTDEAGYAGMVVVGGQSTRLTVSCASASGATTQRTVNLEQPGAGPQVVVALNNPSLEVGGELTGVVRATGGLDRVFVDLVRDGLPILTKTVELTDGEAPLKLIMGPDHIGTLLVVAYHIGHDMTVVQDARPVLVNSTAGLRVELDPHPGGGYRPGEEATLTFRVLDLAGSVVQGAALGIRIVDEALFALVDEAPGLLRLFFTLEQELMAPKLEVHAFSPGDLARTERAGLAARVLSAASDVSWSAPSKTDTAERRRSQVNEAFRPIIRAAARSIYGALKGKDAPESGSWADAAWVGLKQPEGLLDPWGTVYRVAAPDKSAPAAYRIASAGADERFDTADDIGFSRREFQAEDEAATLKATGRGVDEMESGGPPGLAPSGSKAAGVHVRSWFPETLYVNPLVLADAEGRATVRVKLADSITSWKVSTTVNDSSGRIGTGQAKLKVMQDFFVDLNLPESVTQNDELTVPIAVYNYMDTDDAIVITPQLGDAFERIDDGAAIVAELKKGQVMGLSFRVRAKRPGHHTLTVMAQGTTMQDAVKRSVRVVPDGDEHVRTVSGTLDAGREVMVEFPADAIEGGNGLFVKLYPGSFSQVVEGLESMLQMPSGCFEQTSSTTFPNILVLDYLRQQQQVSPELEAKALSYINQGWQRLLTFEVEGGGFSWFGGAPANQVLTAFGVQEFAAMSKVFDIDPKVGERTQKWLMSRRASDGTWKPDKAHLHAENWGDIQKGKLLVTAYITRALALSGVPKEELNTSLNWLDKQWRKADDAYSLALIAGAFAAAEPDSAVTGEVLSALAQKATLEADGKRAFWPAGVRTAVYGTGLTANIETTAMAVTAFMSSKREMELVKPALSWLIAQKDASGTWHATMPTILALNALIVAITDSQETVKGDVSVLLDGQVVEEWAITRQDAEVVRQVDLSERASAGKHRVSLTAAGKGAPAYQVVARHWTPRPDSPSTRPQAFEMAVTYDRTELKRYDVVRATATVISHMPVDSKMLLLDLAIPPGFELVREDLDAAVKAETIARYSVAARQVLVYLEELKAQKSFTVSYRLRATLPMKAKSGRSRVYEYYEPKNAGQAAPELLRVGD